MVKRWGAGLLVAGAALVVLYFSLRAGHVGGIGAPTDLGGGLILLGGYAFGAAGLMVLLVDVTGRLRK